MADDPVLGSERTAGPDEQRLKDQKEKVRVFRKRLHARETFILPEVWDVVSARVMGDAGFNLIGISAKAVAWAQGLKRDERLTLETLVGTAQAIARGFGVPVNADLEGIVGRRPDETGLAAEAVISEGCAGVVFSDGGRDGRDGIAPINNMVAAIQSAKAAALRTKVPAVITARTEAFLLDPPQSSPFETAVERAEAYFAAGADCISIPGVQHIQLIERLAAHIDGPLCITIGLTPAPSVKEFQAAGAACVALGPALLRSLLGTLRHNAE